MVAGSFCIGQRLAIQGQIHRVFRDLGNGLLSLEDLSTGRFIERTIPDLLTAWKAGELIIGEGTTGSDESSLKLAIDRVHDDAFRQSYPEEQQERARARLAYVERLEKHPRTSSVMTPLIHDIWADPVRWAKGFKFAKAPHFTTVVHWIDAYHAAGRDIRALVDRHHDKGNSEERLDPIVRTMVDDLIDTRYLTEERPTLKSIHKDLKGMTAQRNTTRLPTERLKAPSYGHLKRRIADLAPYDVCRARYGQRVAEIKFRASGRGVLALMPLARACMDHTRMDVFVVDENSGLPLGRPWLTVVIDEHSRYVLGYYLSFEEPSGVSMVRALRHALAPKDPSPDVKNEWDAWGVMDTLACDNGLEFHGRMLEMGAGRYGITIQFCPRRKPWFKGKIERHFGTVSTGLLVDVKGKTFSNVFLKGDYEPAKHAVMTLATMRRIVHMWIVDVYHQDVHRTLRTTPAAAWRDGMVQVDRYLPPSSIAMDAAFSASTTRRLTHKGIEFDLLLYNSKELGAVRELYGNEIEVEIRTSDEDIGSIVVVSPDGKTVIKVPALEIEYATGLTRWQHKVCKRFQRAALEDDAREISLLDARNRIRALIEQDMQLAKSRKTRNKQQRFLEQGVASEAPETEPTATAATRDSTATATPHVLLPEPTVLSVPPTLPAPVDTVATNDDADDIPQFSSRKIAQGGAP